MVCRTPFQAICHPAGQRTKPRQGVPTLGPATGMGPRARLGPLNTNQQRKPVPGPVYAKALQSVAGWRKGAPTPGSGMPVSTVGSQFWRRDPLETAARRPHTRAPQGGAGRARPLRLPVRATDPLSGTPCTPRDGGDHRQERTRPRGALDGFEEANESPSGHPGQPCHLDAP
ncbi:hypothetical protein NDU88_004755 [Pleurodeles waltl]|uniref:Uncharacterized protein n=1 Tax=Pleurodeles waltl TaxID=8319 RepID=A0AAV7MWC4_PLEWA|nr:hypothetical protein NDU88_004755 [Pleurodeles waltl]